MKAECTGTEFELQGIAGRSVTVKNDGENISSDGGLILLSMVDKKYGIIDRMMKGFRDLRNPDIIIHQLATLLRQRIFGLCQGYEDINDHDQWRLDPLLSVACEKVPSDRGLAGKGTLNRLELGATADTPKSRYKNIRYVDSDIRKQLLALFMQTHPCGRRGPREIVIDVDSTEDPLYGNQEGRYFNGFYDSYCYLPLYMFVGEFPVWAELRTSDIDSAAGVVRALEEIIHEIRKRWKRTRIILRGDSGFNRPDILDWCEGQANVFYVIGQPKNSRLISMVESTANKVAKLCKETGVPHRIFRELRYKTKKSWKRLRRVVAKVEHLPDGANPRFIVTNLSTKHWDDRALYEDLYCARGNMENRIKEQKLFLFADRLSSHTIRANQLRLWFSTFAYLFTVFLRREGCDNPSLVHAQASTIRLRLLKVAARVSVSCRRIIIHIPEAFPFWNTWMALQQRLQI